MKKKELRIHVLLAVMIWMGWSCQVTDRELGTDLLPAGDEVFLYHDTIFEIHTYPVSGQPVLTHERGENLRSFLVGSTRDTIVGSTEAFLLTHFNTTSSYRNGPNLVIDSLVLYLYVDRFIGDTLERMTIRVHELTERIYRDSVYASDYEVEGKYDPVPLAEYSFFPRSNNTYPFLIEDQDFLDKFYERETDTVAFTNDSVFKNLFKGFFIQAVSDSPHGAMAGVQLNNSLSKVAMKYASDSTEVDTTAGQDFVWTNFTINELSSQKVGVFEHDHSGTHLGGIIDREDADSRYCYVQGMAGVNTRFSFANLQEWIDRQPIVVNSATLMFEVVPEEESGIPIGALPDRLMVFTELGPGEYQEFYDFISFYQVDTRASGFGGYLDTEAESMFADTTYTYHFNVTLHFQAMVNEDKLDNNFILQVYRTRDHPEFAKLWSNLPAMKQRLRLEVVYVKL